jgi:hypothetical protein
MDPETRTSVMGRGSGRVSVSRMASRQRRFPARDADAIPLVGGIEQRVGHDAHRHARADARRLRARHLGARARLVLAGQEHAAPASESLHQRVVDGHTLAGTPQKLSALAGEYTQLTDLAA